MAEYHIADIRRAVELLSFRGRWHFEKEQDNPSIGLLLCKSKNDLVAEYSLKDMSKPIGVSEYQITSDFPIELGKQLPSAEDIQKHIQR